MNSIKSEFNARGYKFSRSTDEVLSLPYNLETIKIAPNEVGLKNVIDKKIEYLYENFLYIYGVSNFASYQTPYKYLSSYGVNKYNNTPGFYSNTESLSNFSYFKNLSTIDISLGGKILKYEDIFQGYPFIVFDKERITLFNLNKDKNSLNYYNSYTSIDPLSGDIQFKNITSIAVNNEDKILYVVDAFYNNVYSYRLGDVLNKENIVNKKIFLNTVVGGIGGRFDKNKFGDIKNIAYKNNKLVVEDYLNKCFKVYDKNLNWLNTSVFYSLFNSITSFSNLTFDGDGYLWASKNRTLYKFDANFEDNEVIKLLSSYNISEYFDSDEVIRSINFPVYDKSIFYVLTNKKLYKKWNTKINNYIGVLSSKDNFRWMTNDYNSTESDNVLIFDRKLNTVNNTTYFRDYISFYEDKLVYDSFLVEDDFNIFNLDDIFINEKEYHQAFVYTNAFKKLYYNIFLLLKKTFYKYTVNKNQKILTIADRTYNKIILNYYQRFSYPDNIRIGLNENFQSEVFNRCIEEIYKFYIIFLKNIVNYQLNYNYLSPNPSYGEDIASSFIYFSDDSIFLTPNPASIDLFEEIIPGPGILMTLGGAPYNGTDSITIE